MEAVSHALPADLVPDMTGTLDPSKESQRSMEWLDWMVRVYLPTWLDLLPSMADQAAEVRSLPAVTRHTVPLVAQVLKRVSLDTPMVVMESSGDGDWQTARFIIEDETAIGCAEDAAMVGAEPLVRMLPTYTIHTTAVVCAWRAILDSDRVDEDLAPTIEALQDSAAALLRRQCGQSSTATTKKCVKPCASCARVLHTSV